MHVFIVYCHPSEQSFTSLLRNEFIKGLLESGNTYNISDLYKMDFRTDISENEYLRESNYINNDNIEEDVRLEQDKLQKCDALVFIYPVFWTEAPAKLVGWFDRVLTYGFAYGDKNIKKMKIIGKSLILCIAGHTKENLIKYGHLQSMENVMIKDRLFGRVEKAEMHIFDGMTKGDDLLRNQNWKKHLENAYQLGLCINDKK